MMRFLYAKINLKDGISDTKIWQKSGNPVPDFFHFGGDGMSMFLYFQVIEFRP